MIARYLGLTTSGELALADAIALVGLRHAVDPEMRKAAKMYSAWCCAHVDALQPAIERYGSVRSADGERLRRALFRGNRLGNFGLLRDIHDLVTLATSVRGCWSALNQAARESRDLDLVATSRNCHGEISSADRVARDETASLRSSNTGRTERFNQRTGHIDSEPCSSGCGGRSRSSGAAATIRANCSQRRRPRLGVRRCSGYRDCPSSGPAQIGSVS